MHVYQLFTLENFEMLHEKNRVSWRIYIFNVFCNKNKIGVSLGTKREEETIREGFLEKKRIFFEIFLIKSRVPSNYCKFESIAHSDLFQKRNYRS